MTTPGDWLFWLAFICGAISMFLMFKEQRIGIRVESLQLELDAVERIVSAIRNQDWHTAFAETLYVERQSTLFRPYWQGEVPESDARASSRAREIARALSVETCRTALEIYGVRDLMEQKAAASLDRWRRLTIPATHARRRRLTYLGSFLGALAFLLSGIKDRVGDPQPKVERITVTRSLYPTLVKPILLFGPGQTALSDTSAGGRDLKADLCTLKRNLLSTGTTAVMIVAHHDHRMPSPALARRYTSNAGIARARADAVAASLSTSDSCGSGVTVSVSLLGGPSVNAASAKSDEVTQVDRSVWVYGLR